MAVCRDKWKIRLIIWASGERERDNERMLRSYPSFLFLQSMNFAEKSSCHNGEHTLLLYTDAQPEKSAWRHKNTSKKALLRNTCSGRFTFTCSCVWWCLVCGRKCVLDPFVYAWPHTTGLDKTHQRNTLSHAVPISLLPSTIASNCTIVQRWQVTTNIYSCTVLKYSFEVLIQYYYICVKALLITQNLTIIRWDKLIKYGCWVKTLYLFQGLRKQPCFSFRTKCVSAFI